MGELTTNDERWESRRADLLVLGAQASTKIWTPPSELVFNKLRRALSAQRVVPVKLRTVFVRRENGPGAAGLSCTDRDHQDREESGKNLSRTLHAAIVVVSALEDARGARSHPRSPHG